MKKIILASVLFLLPVLLPAQNSDSKKYIEVTGTSETEITPDEIFISITLQERAENKEKLNIEKQEEELKRGLKELGLDLSNLVLNTANADFRKIKSLKKDVVTSKSYLLKVGTADMVDKVYKHLDKMNAHDAYIFKLSHSKITDMAKENRIKAIKAAKDKAEYLLVAVNKTAGDPLQITETLNSIENNPHGYYYGRYGGYAGNVAQSYSSANISLSESSSEDGGEDISIKKIKIKASFLVKYEIR